MKMGDKHFPKGASVDLVRFIHELDDDIARGYMIVTGERLAFVSNRSTFLRRVGCPIGMARSNKVRLRFGSMPSPKGNHISVFVSFKMTA